MTKWLDRGGLGIEQRMTGYGAEGGGWREKISLIKGIWIKKDKRSTPSPLVQQSI